MVTAAQDYKLARKLANDIAATFVSPSFFTELRRERDISREMLYSDSILEESRRIVRMKDEQYGHGLTHLEKVATDAGAIVQRELTQRGSSPEHIERAVFLVLLASMLHDVRRRTAHHARQSALEAAGILKRFPLKELERQWIVHSIRNHEAFVEPTPIGSPEGQLLSDALYDADKFRWGPDNFTDTLWEMVSPDDVPIRVLMAHFPKGVEGVKKIAGTFRSGTGLRYGPEFIEIGLAIGQRLYDELMSRFPPERDRTAAKSG